MLKKVKLHTIANTISRFAPELVPILTDLAAEHGDEFYRLRYPFGAKIIDTNGEFRLPNGIGIAELDNSTQADLDYNRGRLSDNSSRSNNALPLGLVTCGQCELFSETTPLVDSPETDIDSLGLLRCGDFIGLDNLRAHNSIHNNTSFAMTSGVRSAFMLPGIKNSIGFERLCARFASCRQFAAPKTLHNHWDLFKTIAGHTDFGASWYTEIILFPKKILLALQANYHAPHADYRFDSASRFINYVCDSANTTPTTTTDSAIDSFLWDKLLGHYGQYSHALIYKVKKILLSGLGKLPAYNVCVNNDAGPFLELAQIFLEAYQWSEYAPIIMVPGYIHWNDPTTGYCTMNHNAKPKFSASSPRTVAADAMKTKDVIRFILARAHHLSKLLAGTELEQLLNLNVDFYQYAPHKTNEMLPNHAMFAQDDSMGFWLRGGKKPAFSNSFLRCCAKVSTHS